MTEHDTDELETIVKNVLDDVFRDRVYRVEDGQVWVSGMNAHCRSVARRMAQTLVEHDVPTGLVYDDDAEYYGGVQFNFGPRDHGS